jgi:hypothetical protein
MNASLSAHPSTTRYNDIPHNQPTVGLKEIASVGTKLSSLSNRENLLSGEHRRQNVLINQAKYTLINPITNLDNPVNYSHNVGVIGNKSMTEYLYKRAQKTGVQPLVKRSYEL